MAGDFVSTAGSAAGTMITLDIAATDIDGDGDQDVRRSACMPCSRRPPSLHGAVRIVLEYCRDAPAGDDRQQRSVANVRIPRRDLDPQEPVLGAQA